MPRAIVSVVLALATAGIAGACGAFALNDVVPEKDASLPDRPGDSFQPEASGSCDAAADPCACLPSPELLTTGGGSIKAFRVAGGYAYFVAGATNVPQVYRVSTASFDGGPPELVGGVGSWGSDEDFTVGSSSVYYANGSSAPSIGQVPFDGGGYQLITPVLPNLPYDLTATSAALYWTDIRGEVCRASLDGSIAPGDSGCGGASLSPPVPDASYNNHIALTDGGIWLAVVRTGALLRVPYRGGAGTLVADLQQLASSIVGTDTNVFFFDETADGGTIYREPAAGGSPAVVVHAGDKVTTIAIDDANVYYIQGTSTVSDRYVYEVPWSGGTPKLLACDTSAPGLLAVDAQYVYWANVVNGEVKRVPK